MPKKLEGRLTPEQQELVATKGVEAARLAVADWMRANPHYAFYRDDALGMALESAAKSALTFQEGMGSTFFSWAYNAALSHLRRVKERAPTIRPVARSKGARGSQKRHFEYARLQSLSSPVKGSEEGESAVEELLADEAPSVEETLCSTLSTRLLERVEADMRRALESRYNNSHRRSIPRKLEGWKKARLEGRTVRDVGAEMGVSHQSVQFWVTELDEVAMRVTRELRAA